MFNLSWLLSDVIIFWAEMVYTSSRYEIKNDEDTDVGEDVLVLMYGNRWKFIMDRFDHQYDGHVFTFHHQGKPVKVYRKLSSAA